MDRLCTCFSSAKKSTTDRPPNKQPGKSNAQTRWTVGHPHGWIATVATPSMAQRKSELRTDAKDQAAQIRSVGEPKDRCTLDAGFGPSGAITAIYGSPTFSLGDKLLVINGTDVKGQGDKASEVLRGIAPGSTISVKVERAGTEVDLAPTLEFPGFPRQS